MNQANQVIGRSKDARPPVLRATSEADGRRAATVNADTLSVEDASSCELARVVASGRERQFSRRQQGEPRPSGAEAGSPDGGDRPDDATAKTLLQAYLDRNGIPAARLEREGPFARETLRRWRLGEVEMRRKPMVRVLGVLRRITNKPVRMEEIFDLDPSNPDNWID